MAIIMQYVYISVDAFYIFIVTIKYTYIFIQFRRRKRRRSNIALTKKKNQDQFNLTFPTLVIATFILFNICPNFFGIFIRTSPGDRFSMESEVPRVLYTLGWISDPLIYLCTHRTRLRLNIYKKKTRKIFKISIMKKTERHSWYWNTVSIGYPYYILFIFLVFLSLALIWFFAQ